MDIAALVHNLGGMAQKRQLVARGARDLDLTRAVRSSEVVRVRNGWYTTLPETDERVRAVRVGGRLTGISAIAAMGGWVPNAHRLQVAVPSNAARQRSQWNRRRRLSAKDGVSLHWDDVPTRGTSMVVGLIDALERVVLDEDFEVAVAALDWAIHVEQLDILDLEALATRLPANRRDIVRWVDPACESLPESNARVRLRLDGYTVVTQVVLPSGRRIDALVDDVVALEVDGARYHRDFFERDRLKDLEITLAGYHALRASARMVSRRWEEVAGAVRVALASRAGSSFGNSGNRRRDPRRAPGISAWMRGRPRESPEFPKGRGEYRGGERRLRPA